MRCHNEWWLLRCCRPYGAVKDSTERTSQGKRGRNGNIDLCLATCLCGWCGASRVPAYCRTDGWRMLGFLSLQEVTCLNSIFTHFFYLLPRDHTINLEFPTIRSTELCTAPSARHQPLSVRRHSTNLQCYSLSRHLGATSFCSSLVDSER